MKQKQSPVTTKRQRMAAARRHSDWLPLGLIGLGAVVLVTFFVLSIKQASGQTAVPPRVGVPLGNFALSDIDGQKVALKDYEGQVVLVNAWATWCPPCRAEMPDINAYYQAHQQDGFTVLAVNAGDSQPEAAAFAQSYALAFPVLLDTDMRLLDSMRIQNFPTSIVLGRDGRVKHIQVGMFSPEALDSVITPLLAQ